MIVAIVRPIQSRVTTAGTYRRFQHTAEPDTWYEVLEDKLDYGDDYEILTNGSKLMLTGRSIRHQPSHMPVTVRAKGAIVGRRMINLHELFCAHVVALPAPAEMIPTESISEKATRSTMASINNVIADLLDNATADLLNNATAQQSRESKKTITITLPDDSLDHLAVTLITRVEEILQGRFCLPETKGQQKLAIARRIAARRLQEEHDKDPEMFAGRLPRICIGLSMDHDIARLRDPELAFLVSTRDYQDVARYARNIFNKMVRIGGSVRLQDYLSGFE